ncbi:hypothetical protein BJ322DRAFT_1021632 [Thelephora terrestris]|uniref:Uncharacterized protein n=1 Tax=Thelephora terrestris TaxID=56493 RepID=A0A9P6HCM6_9AGAM|nr:hypothetical protein BJ322DRAFT_1021632 [Thelephora terrestris]
MVTVPRPSCDSSLTCYHSFSRAARGSTPSDQANTDSHKVNGNDVACSQVFVQQEPDMLPLLSTYRATTGCTSSDQANANSHKRLRSRGKLESITMGTRRSMTVFTLSVKHSRRFDSASIVRQRLLSCEDRRRFRQASDLPYWATSSKIVTGTAPHHKGHATTSRRAIQVARSQSPISSKKIYAEIPSSMIQSNEWNGLERGGKSLMWPSSLCEQNSMAVNITFLTDFAMRVGTSYHRHIQWSGLPGFGKFMMVWCAISKPPPQDFTGRGPGFDWS